MSITSAIVLYAILWFLIMFIVLPIRLKTQGEAGEIVPGTHASAPSEVQMWVKVKQVTLFATVTWALVAGVILSGVITSDMIEGLTRD